MIRLPRVAASLIAVLSCGAIGAVLAGCGGSSPLTAADARTCEADLTSADDLQVVVFDAFPDLSQAYGMDDWQERGRWVVDQLRTTAEQSQAEAVEMVKEAGICIHRTTVNWAANTMVFAGPPDLGQRVAGLPGVKAVLSEDTPAFDRAFYDKVPAPAKPAWDLQMVKAPQAWSKGITGKGVTIGVIDTGSTGSTRRSCSATAGTTGRTSPRRSTATGGARSTAS